MPCGEPRHFQLAAPVLIHSLLTSRSLPEGFLSSFRWALPGGHSVALLLTSCISAAPGCKSPEGHQHLTKLNDAERNRLQNMSQRLGTVCFSKHTGLHVLNVALSRGHSSHTLPWVCSTSDMNFLSKSDSQWHPPCMLHTVSLLLSLMLKHKQDACTVRGTVRHYGDSRNHLQLQSMDEPVLLPPPEWVCGLWCTPVLAQAGKRRGVLHKQSQSLWMYLGLTSSLGRAYLTTRMCNNTAKHVGMLLKK